MNDIDQLITDGLNHVADSAPHRPDLGAVIIRSSRHRQALTLAPIAVALAVIAAVGTVMLASPRTVDPAARPASACSPITSRVLPLWARAGFSDPSPVSPFVTSHAGEVVAIVFADPLLAPAKPGAPNKILWVSKDGASTTGPLTISGTLEGGTSTMRATVMGGPGPSIVDVPVAGCWRFNLSWGTHQDKIDIPYQSK
jgi:hypothetical protein